MARIERNEGRLIKIDGIVRIEYGPARKRAIATPELLSDSKTHPIFKAGGKDAAGVVIQHGKEMEYLDFFGGMGWYVFHWEPYPQWNEKVKYNPHFHSDGHYWHKVGWFATKAEAETVAFGLLNK